MDLQQRLKQLEEVHDWQGVLDELEKALSAESQPSDKAQLHLQIGRLLDDKFLHSVKKALKHFQDAFKLQPGLVDALAEARSIYWRLGKLNMVQKLIDLELKAELPPERSSALLLELGDVLGDEGDGERATSSYASALKASRGANTEASACLEDAQIESGGWQDRVAFLLRSGHQETDETTRARLFLRASRIAHRFAPEEREAMLAKAFESDPTNKQVVALYEGMLLDAGRQEDLVAAHRAALDAELDTSRRAHLAYGFAMHWAARPQTLDIAAQLAEEAIALHAQLEPAFLFLKEVWGTRDGDWDRVVRLAESAHDRSTQPSARTFYLAQAGVLSWQKLGNMLQAQRLLERLCAIAPSHPSVRAFELQIGQALATARSSIPAPAAISAPTAAAVDEPPRHRQSVVPEAANVEAPEALDTAPKAAATPESTPQEPVPPAAQPVPDAEPAADSSKLEEAQPLDSPAQEAAPAHAPTDLAKLSELREAAVKQEAAKRFNELVKTLLGIADLVQNPAEKIELYQRAADLFVTKFANQAEAIKAYEKVLDHDPGNAKAIDYLMQMYERRRDWENLIRLRRTQADQMARGDRLAQYVDIADIATKRLRKPELSIELWSEVLLAEPGHEAALAALVPLYEHTKQYVELAKVIEKQADATSDTKTKLALLTKLGAVYGDRLNDDDGAANAWRQVLDLTPDDRRAAEQWRKRLLTLERWDDLERFYADSGKWDDFIRVLESQEEKESDTAKKLPLLMKVAKLWADKKGKADRATKALEKVLSLDPQHLVAAQELDPIYREAKNARGLATVLEVKLAHEEDDFARLELLREVATIYETHLKDSNIAFDRFLAAFEILPGDDVCRDDVERLAKGTERWADLIASYRRAIGQAQAEGEHDSITTLRLTLGRVLVEEVQSIDEALVEYAAVHAADDTNVPAIEALESLYRQTGRFDDLLKIYECKRDLAGSFEDKRAVLHATAKLYEEQMQRPSDAIAVYRSVLDEDPTDLASLHALDALHTQLKDYPNHADVLRRLIELDVDEAALIDLKFRLGTTLETHLQDVQGALENYREILLLDQGHDGARLALESMLRNADLRAEAALILDPIYEARGEWEKLIEVLEVLADSKDDATTQVEFLRRIARTAATKLGDLPRAFDAQARALRQDPASPESRAELETLAAESSAWNKLETIFSGIAEALTDVALAREYWMRLAAIEEKLGKVDEAAAGYVRVLAVEPADDEALAALDALYRRTERWTDLINVYRKRIELAEDFGAREALYVQAAEVYETCLRRPADAIAAYREILALDEASGVALAALDGLFGRQKMWVELSENLEAQLRLAETDEAQISLMLRLAWLRESEMAQIEQAIEIYREVLDREPSAEAGLTALERLGRLPDYELTIAEILEPLHRQAGDFKKLIGVHEVQVRRSDDPLRRVELLHAIAQLHEDAAGDLDSAFDTLARALTEEPAHAETQSGLDRLARATGRFADLAGVFETLANRQEDPQLASQLFSTAARVFEQDLRDADNAVRLHRRVLAIEPTNLVSAEALEGLFRGSERYADLSLVLQRKAEILEDAQSKKDALFQAAAIEEEMLQRPEFAIGVYLKLLDIDPDDLQAVDALIARYVGLNRWQELLAAYTKKADLVIDPEEKKLIFYQMGAVYERELRDLPRAIDTYQRVLELDPDDMTSLGRLDVLYQVSASWQDLLSVLQHEAELTQDPAESVSYQYRIAELYERHLGDTQRSIELYREILAQQSDHAPTLEALERLKDGDADPLAAASVLEPFYDGAGAWAKLVSVLEVQVRFQDDPFQKVELLHRIAALHQDGLQAPAAAFDTYARALSLDNTNQDTLAALESLASVTDRWALAASLYDLEIARLDGNPEWLVEFGLRTAGIYELQLVDTDAAVARYRRVLAVDVENERALGSLDRLFQQAQRWGDLAQVLVREAETAGAPDAALEFKYRLGQVHQLRLADMDSAVGAYRDVIAAAPDHSLALAALEQLFASGVKQLDIAQILEPLYTDNGDWEKLARVYQAQLPTLSEASERLAMHCKLAELFETSLVDPDRALDVYVQAIKEFPSDEHVVEELERLAAGIDGGWGKLGNAYADVLESSTAPAVQKAIGKRHARVFEEESRQIDNAIATYRYVLGVDSRDADALANLDRIFDGLEQHPELAQVLEQRVAATQDTTDLVELCTRLGATYEERLHQYDDAIRAFRRVFDELDPSNETAISALERLYEHKQAWVDLNVVYERQLGNAMGDIEEADIRAKMARLAAGMLGDVARAVDTWKRVLDLRGEDAEALGALANLHEGQLQWSELCEILERQFDIADSDEARTAIRLRRAHVFLERIGRTDEALEDFQRTLEIDFANVDALRSIANIWRSRGDAYALVGALQSLVDRAGTALDPTELKAIYRELGITYGVALEQPVDAAEAWTNLLGVDPADFEALAALEAISTTEERWADVVDVKMRRSDALTEPSERIRELLEAAAIWSDRVGDKDAGTLAFEKILGIDPTHDGAFLALEELHAAAQRWEPLIELYLARLDTREAVPERTGLLRKIAKVFEERVEDKNQAFDALLTAFEADYGDNETARYLERMAQTTGRWPELIQSANDWLVELQASKQDTQKIIQLSLRLAKWYGEDLGQVQYAHEYFKTVMQLDPTNVAVLRQRGSLFRKNHQWPELGRTLMEAMRHATSETDRKEIQTELGELLEKLNDVDQGLVYYKKALEVDPYHLPALAALERLYAEQGKQRELVAVLESKVVALKDDEEQVAGLKVRIGGIWETALADANAAAQAYRAALEAVPGSLVAMRGLERICNAQSNWQELIKVLDQQLDVVPTERERIEVLLKLASIYEQQFLKPEDAASRFEQVVDIDPSQETALVGLERCYAKMRQWLDLVNTYERHVAVTLDRNQKIDLHGHIAHVFATEVDDVDRAIDAYQNIVDLDDANVGALDQLAKLYEKKGSASDAIDFMTRVAELTADGAQRVEMYYRIGRSLDTLGERIGAREKYEVALDLDPTHLATLAALKDVALDAGEFDQAAQYLEQEQLHTQAPRQRARLLVELGKLRDEKLEEHALAVQAYESALQADGENEEAAKPLLKEYVGALRWAEAEPLADMLLRKASKGERFELHHLQKALGRIAAALGNDEKALKAYKEAFNQDSTDRESIRGLAEVSFKLGDWAGALTNYQKVLTSLDEDSREERAEVYYKLGCVKRHQSQVKQAVNNFEKALAIDEAHRPSLQSLVAIFSELSEWKQVCAYKRQILDNIFDGDERFLMLIEVGDVWTEREKNTAKAIEAFEEALELKPDNHVLLHKLLGLYQASRNYDKMIDTIQAIADLETSAERKARYLYTMAQLYRDQQDLGRAVELFNDALDLNPDFLESFERINKILTAQKDWKQLERSFRKMIHRVRGKGKVDLEYTLWHNLGVVYRDRLNEVGEAIESFKVAAQLKPEDATERLILAELYETAGQFDLAIEEQQEILRRDPTQVAPYRALYQLFYTKEAHDEAWCMCAALSFLRRADEGQQKFFEDYRPNGIPQARNRIDNETWRKLLCHRDEDVQVGQIFEMLTQAALTAKIRQSQAAKQLPVLDKRYKQDPQATTVTFAKTFFHVAKMLGIAAPELYVDTNRQGGLKAEPVIPFATVAGQGVLSGFTPHELSFLCAKHLSNYRAEHYIKNVFPTQSELTQLFFAGLRMVLPDAPVLPEIAQSVDVTAKALAPLMAAQHQEGLRHVARKFMESKPQINVRKWLQATELTACRAGLIVCGDLEIAKKVLVMEPHVPGEMTPQEKIAELTVFSVSNEYFALRKALGIAIG